MSPYTAALHVLSMAPADVRHLEAELGELVPDYPGKASVDHVVAALTEAGMVRRRTDGLYELTP